MEENDQKNEENEGKGEIYFPVTADYELRSVSVIVDSERDYPDKVNTPFESNTLRIKVEGIILNAREGDEGEDDKNPYSSLQVIVRFKGEKLNKEAINSCSYGLPLVIADKLSRYGYTDKSHSLAIAATGVIGEKGEVESVDQKQFNIKIGFLLDERNIIFLEPKKIFLFICPESNAEKYPGGFDSLKRDLKKRNIELMCVEKKINELKNLWGDGSMTIKTIKRKEPESGGGQQQQRVNVNIYSSDKWTIRILVATGLLIFLFFIWDDLQKILVPGSNNTIEELQEESNGNAETQTEPPETPAKPPLHGKIEKLIDEIVKTPATLEKKPTGKPLAQGQKTEEDKLEKDESSEMVKEEKAVRKPKPEKFIFPLYKKHISPDLLNDEQKNKRAKDIVDRIIESVKEKKDIKNTIGQDWILADFEFVPVKKSDNPLFNLQYSLKLKEDKWLKCKTKLIPNDSKLDVDDQKDKLIRKIKTGYARNSNFLSKCIGDEP